MSSAAPEIDPGAPGDPVGGASALREQLSSKNVGDRVFRWVTGGVAAISVALLAAVAIELALSARPSIDAFGAGFLWGRVWDYAESFGALPFIAGTMLSAGLALLFAVPVALGAALFLTEFAPTWVGRSLGFFVELLAAVPSVIFGLWGIFAVAPWVRETVQPAMEAWLGWLPFVGGPKTGFGLFTGGLILAIMILPTITSVSREVLRATPLALREGALALGATRWETVRRGVLPVARSGLVGAIMLGFGRALGETMAVTMVIGNRPEVVEALFGPSYTLASAIANEYTEATSELHRAALAELGLVLFGVTLLLNFAARWLVSRVGRLAS